ncbi:hypothetical protein O1W68_03210 [Rhodococcus sp. H36-A4]|uniref:hypothetical protein n=1 Tax=Rhodococcus sp. H36-A4 TaxID=3004353 RepID=UPI0022AF23ED|nr:hypothetical protein [Rhodococcus sp. H36-A4]MCZ4076942.1 hypothetical protein [Rhodococcus sp. H36-A4]
MKLSSLPVLCIAAAVSVGLAGCGSDDSADAAPDVDICAQLQDIADFETSSMSTLSGDPSDWPAMQASLKTYADGLSEHYDPAINADDPDVSPDLAKLKDASVVATSTAADAPTYEAFTEKSTTSMDADTAQDAMAASDRVNKYATEKCGFSLSQPPA